MACGIVDIFESNCDDSTTEVILIQKIPYFGVNCLTIADEAGCLKFISLISVQNLISYIWDRPKAPFTRKKTSLEADMMDEKRIDTAFGQLDKRNIKDEVNKNKLIGLFELLISPKGYFILDYLFYFVFLMLFCYFVLIDLRYFKPIVTNSYESKNNTDNLKINKREKAYPSSIECILIFWIFSFLLEEFRQVI